MIDWHVVGVDEDGDAWTDLNPFPVYMASSVLGTFSSTPVVGEVIIGGVAYPVLEQVIDYAVVAATQQIAAVALKQLWVLSFDLNATLNCELEWRSNTTVVRGPIFMSPRVPYGRDYMLGPWMKTATGEGLFFRQAQDGGAGEAAAVRGVVHYAEVTP